MTTLARWLFCITSASIVSSSNPVLGQVNAIPTGASIYIEEMDADLDGYIRAEFVKQEVPLKIVLSRADAHIVMVGTSGGTEKRSWHEGWLTSEKDHATGNITVIDRASKAMLWAAEAGDRSLWWGAMARGGQRKVASRLIKDLKKAIKGSLPLPPPIPLTPDEAAASRQDAVDTTHQTDLARTAVAGAKPLTNEDVIKMVSAGLTEDLIIDKINASSPRFNVDTDGLIELKKAGVPDKVVAAMIGHQGS
jgi:hypothetical protein